MRERPGDGCGKAMVGVMGRCNCQGCAACANHRPCSEEATEGDQRCKPCHDQAALDWAAAQPQLPVSFPTWPQAARYAQRVREYRRRHPFWFTLNVIIGVCPPFLGLVVAGWTGVVVGLAVGLLSIFVGERASTHVIERGGG